MNALPRPNPRRSNEPSPKPPAVPRRPSRGVSLLSGLIVLAVASILLTPGAVSSLGSRSDPSQLAQHPASPTGAAETAATHPEISATLGISPQTTDVGLAVTVRTTITGASGTFSLAYSGLPPGCSSSDSVLFSCVPDGAGDFTVTVNIVNTTGATGSASAAMEVNSRPTVTSFAPDPATITVGQSTTFTVVASGGSSPVSVLEYSGLPVGCASSPSFTLQCQPSVPGTFAVSVLAADELGAVAGGNTTLTVNPTSGGTGGGIRVNSFSAFPNPLELGGSTTLSVAASGGNGSLYYSYGGLPGGCGSANEASIGCVPSEPGNFTVTVAVQDDLGDSSWAELLLTVVPPLPSSSVPGGPSVIGFWASPAVISIGGTTVLQVLASGGTLPLSYLYEGLPQGCESASVSSLSCTPTVAGPFTVEVVVTDAAGNHGSSTVFFLVNSPSAGAIVPGVPPGTDLGWIGAFAPGLAIGAVAMLLAVFLSGRNRPPAAPRRTPNPNTPLAIPRAADRPKVVPASVEVPEGSVES